MNRRQSDGVGMGVPAVLGIVFITLKLCGVIHWSWGLVLAPFWLPLAALAGAAAIGGYFYLIRKVTS